MGKHTKRNADARGSGPELDWDSRDDRVEFDFLEDEDGDILDLDAESVLSEFFPEEDTEQGAEIPVWETEPEPEPHSPARDLPDIKKEKTAAVREKPAPAEAQPKTRKKPAGKKQGQSAAARTKKEAARSKRRFRRGLTAYVLIVLALIIGTLVYEWIALEKSQAKLDAEAAEEAARKAALAEQQAHEKAVYQAPQLTFEAWRQTADAAYWADLWLSENDSPFDAREAVESFMAQRFETAEAFRSMDYTAAAPVYVLKDGTETLARIALTGSELDWSVSDVELLIKGTESASVRVASGSRVTCNGTELGAEYVVNSDSYFKYEPLQDKLVNPVSWDTYEVSGLLLKPELAVEPPAGGIITETAEGDFLLCLDKDAGKTYQDKAVAFVKSYLFYYMSGYNGTWGNLYAALAHLTPGYQAYKDLQDTYNGVVWNTAYGNIDTSKTTAGDAVIWADNCLSVDVTYDADCTLNGQAIDYADATMRIYFLKTDAGFIISNFETL